MLKSFLIPLVAVSFTFVNPCSKPKDFGPGKDDQVFEVKTVAPEFVSVPESYHVDGQFDVSDKAIVTAHIPGTIEQIFVNEGDFVAKDDPLVTLSNQTLLETIDIKRAKIKEFQNRLAEIDARLEDNRGEDLPVNTDDANFLDEEPVDQPVEKNFGNAEETKKTPKSLKAMAELLQSAIDRHTKEADALDRKLLNLTVPSPVSGVVIKKYATEGNVVKEQQALVEVATTDPLSVTFHVPDSVANFVDKNSKVTVTPKEAPKLVATGTVYFISPNIDSEKGTMEVRAHIANPQSKIKGGQVADVFLATRKMSRVMILPETAVFEKDGKSYVYTVLKERAKLVEVKPQPHDKEGQVKILGADLRVDDPILVDFPSGMEHNSFVRILKDEES